MITSWEIPHPPKHWSTFRLQMVPYPYLIAVDFHTVATKVENSCLRRLTVISGIDLFSREGLFWNRRSHRKVLL